MIGIMGLQRPAPQSRTSLDPHVRSILLRAGEEGLTLGGQTVPSVGDREIWFSYTGAQLVPTTIDQGLQEIGRRYGIRGLDAELLSRVRAYVERTEIMGLAPYPDMANEQMARAAEAIGTAVALELLPDQEFLTAYQDAYRWVEGLGKTGRARAQHMREHADRVFRMYGLPYDIRNGEISWVGDAVTRTDVLEPALLALEDARVTGARAEFLQAQAALRGGTHASLRDATHEAGNAVEAVLLALLSAHALPAPRARTAAPLFNVLRDRGVLPAALENAVMAAPQLRNAQGGHTQGALVTHADQQLAQSAVAAAAVAITALVAYLP